MSIHLVNQAPEGTKLWLLHIGYFEVDEALVINNANISTASHPFPKSQRRKLAMISALIEHPTEGLLLFETGGGQDYPEVWGPQLSDVFARVDYSEDQELEKVIAKTGHNIKDIEGVIMGHLHIDHAGGLAAFRGTEIPIYVHEEELKHAFYSVATKSDYGAYLPTYLKFDLNWKTFTGSVWEMAKGLNIIHAPGHTPGLCMLQINLPKSGSWIFTSDQYVVKDNYESSTPQGWLARDHADWIHSNQMVHSLQKLTDAKLVFGHDLDTLFSFKIAPEYYE